MNTDSGIRTEYDSGTAKRRKDLIKKLMKTIVAKFGGSSLADAGQFRKVKSIIDADPSRRIVVASAPGKRFEQDNKITDILLKCYEDAVSGKDCEPWLKKIKERFMDIIRELGLEFPLDDEIDILRGHLNREVRKDYIVSRGEYLNSRILAAWLGFTFVDPEWCVCFDRDGKLNLPMTFRTMGAALRPLKNAVIAGFYGADMDGNILHFPGEVQMLQEAWPLRPSGQTFMKTGQMFQACFPQIQG